jgi:predicted AlkP superfamily phosphohydrolase/phosphomutase
MTSPRAKNRVLMIALDAAEASLIERWVKEGRLPNLSRLFESGSYGRLGSSADWMAGSPWPTFHTGTLPADHGHYHFIQWHRERMRFLRPTREWLPQRAFWRDAAAAGRRVLAIDLPSIYGPEPLNGVELIGWSNTDLFEPPGSHPPELFGWAQRTFGSAQMGNEVYSEEGPAALIRIRDALLRWTDRTTELALSLMQREAWDLCLVNLSASHRGGHKLWHTLDGAARTPTTGELAGALEAVYARCDRAVGRLVEQAEGATVLVFSLHGMGPNTSRVAILPEMLDRVLAERAEPVPRPGLLGRLRERTPNAWRSRVKSLLPMAVQDRLTIFWRTAGVDVRSRRAFPLVADLQGYVRINVRGREAQGLVEPGAEYDRLCDRIAEGLRSFVDADTGEPVVEAVARSDRLYPPGVHTPDLPDLIVRWSPTQASEHRAVVSPLHGSIPWPRPGVHPDGRTGNHRYEGFLLANGEGIDGPSPLEGGHIVDLAPTVFHRLGLPPRPEWRGAVLALGGEPVDPSRRTW